MNVGAEVSKRFAANAFGTVAGFLGTFYFANALGADGVGAYAVFTSIQMVAGTLTSLGLFQAVTKRVSEGRAEARHFTSGLLVALAGAALAAVGAFALREPIDAVVGVEAAPLIPLAVLSWSLFRLVGAYLAGTGRVALAGVVENGRYVPIVGIQSALVAAGFGVAGLLWGLVVGQFLTFLFAYLRYARVIPARPSRALLAEFLGFSKYMYVRSVAGQLFKHADYLILGQFAGVGAAGIYKLAFTVAESTMLFSSALSQVSFPEFSRLSEGERERRVRELFGKTVSYAGLFAVPALGGGAVIGNALLTTVYGVAPGTVALPVVGAVGLGNALIAALALANLFNGYRGTLESYFAGTNRPAVSAAGAATLILAYAALAPPLLVAFGSFGLAVATTLSFGACCLFLWSRLETTPPRSAVVDAATQAGATVVMMVAVVALRGALGGAAGAGRLAALLTAGVAVYFGTLVAANERLRHDAFWVARDLVGERG